MDSGVGKILAELKRQHIEKNTLVVFLSDNGGCAENLQRDWYDVPTKTRDGRTMRIGNSHKDVLAGPDDVWQSYGPSWANVSNTPFRLYKHWVHEGGIATPLIVSWPGHVAKSGSVTPTIGHVIDLMPTFLDVAIAKYPLSYEGHELTPLVGRSLLPVLKGQATQFERALFWEHEGNRAVRQQDWKLVGKNGKAWELYDMAADRTELKDLAGAMPRKVEAMADQYNSWAQATGVRPWNEVSKRSAAKP
jgi:arylsulfatase A-like enzyme